MPEEVFSSKLGDLQKLQMLRGKLPKARKTKQVSVEKLHSNIISDLVDLWHACEESYATMPRDIQVLTRDLRAKIAKVM